MSKFDFSKLRKQTLATNDLLKKTFKASDAQLQGIANRGEDWTKANTARYEDPNYSLRVGKKISATYQTEEGRAKQSAKRHSQTEEAKEKIRLANTGLKKSDEVKAKISVKKLGNRNHCKPIQTPIGVFASKKEAALAYAQQGKANASKWIGHWLKTKPNEFYYLTN